MNRRGHPLRIAHLAFTALPRTIGLRIRVLAMYPALRPMDIEPENRKATPIRLFCEVDYLFSRSGGSSCRNAPILIRQASTVRGYEIVERGNASGKSCRGSVGCHTRAPPVGTLHECQTTSDRTYDRSSTAGKFERPLLVSLSWSLPITGPSPWQLISVSRRAAPTSSVSNARRARGRALQSASNERERCESPSRQCG